MRKWVYRLTGAVVLTMLFPLVANAAWTWTPQTGRWINMKRLPKETPELQIEFARGLMLKGELKKALDETEKFTKFYRESPLADQNQYLRGEIKMAMGKDSEAAKEFQKVVAKYPNSALYEDVIKKQYEIGDKLYAKGLELRKKKFRMFRGSPLKKAIEVYSMVISNQPFTDAAAEAQYKLGLCHYTRKEYSEAAFEYKRVIEDYATSQWVDDARYGLSICYYDSSLSANYDQKPSELAITAIDEFKQQFPDDARGQELDAKRAEMRTRVAQQQLQTAQYYERRRDFDSARIYYNVLAEKYTDTAQGEKATKWIEQNPKTVVRAEDRILSGQQGS